MRLFTQNIYRNLFEALCFVSLLSLSEFILFYGIMAKVNQDKTFELLTKKVDNEYYLYLEKQYLKKRQQITQSHSKNQDQTELIENKSIKKIEENLTRLKEQGLKELEKEVAKQIELNISVERTSQGTDNRRNLIDQLTNRVNLDTSITLDAINSNYQNSAFRNKYLDPIRVWVSYRFDSFSYLFGLIDEGFKYQNTSRMYLTGIIILIAFILTMICYMIGSRIYGYTITKRSLLISIPITFLFTGFAQMYFTFYVIPKFKLANDAKIQQQILKLMEKTKN